MPNHLSTLGIFHTIISVLALLTALCALYYDGKIAPANGRGKLYILLTAITCLTAFPIMKTGHFTGAHGLALVILVLLLAGIFVKSISALGKASDYLQVFIMSTTLFLSFIPAIVETLTRIPPGHPIAGDANDPIIKMGLEGLILLYTAGIIYQFIKLRQRKI